MVYKKISLEDIKYFETILEPKRVIVKNDIPTDYAHDELKTVFYVPDLLLEVKTTKEVSCIMKYANKQRIPVTVRGSGTGLVGACVAVEGGIILDTSKMNKIIELDKTNMSLTVEPGVMLLEIYDFVEKEELFYAPDPGEKSATIGGNISTNAGGMRAVKYGVTRDWVLGLEVVLPNGEIVNLGGKVVKDSSGYSLKHLLIGSEGTLGIITKAILKLIPLPKEQISLLIPFDNRESAINAVPQVIQSGVLPTAVEFLEQASLRFSEEFLGKKIPNGNHEAYLLVSYDGNTKQEIDSNVEELSEYCINNLDAKDVYLVDTTERKESVWSARGAFLEAIKASTTLIDECDVVIPRSNISEFLRFTNDLSKELNIRVPYFGHAGDGNLHIYFCKDDLTDEEFESILNKGFQKMYDKAFTLGGKVSGEHGIGYAKRRYLKQQLGETQIGLMKEIKSVFDPNYILNPNKVI